MAGHIMKDAELASMLKGQVNPTLTQGTCDTDDESLHLTEEDMKWWRDAKIGMFIHWGIYSIVGKGEWSYFNEKMDEEEYRRIAGEEFKPERPAKEIAEEWIEFAKVMGANYAVMVTRHHDGYTMWDSKHSWKDFTTMQVGPKQDYVKAFTEACREKDVRVGLYYSPMDWRFPGYFDPKGLPENAQLMKQQAYGQIEELATNYGPVDILWYDGGWLSHQGTDADAAWFWEPVKLNKMLRSYQPKVMVTPRSGYRGDFQCDEGPREVKGNIIHQPWEKCLSVSTAWSFIPGDHYHSLEYMIKMLVNTICRGGNLLLNVGPDPQGRIPQEVRDVLKGLGEWLKENGEAVYGTRGGLCEPVEGVYGTTYKDNIMYLHILDCEQFQKEVLVLPDCKIEKACLMNGEPIEYNQVNGNIKILIPEDIINENRTDTIIKLYVAI